MFIALVRFVCVVVVGCLFVGCGSTPPPQTGFISDYSNLQKVGENKMRYISSGLAEYDTFIVDPIQMRGGEESELTAQQKADVAQYFHDRFVEVLKNGGYRLTGDAGVGTARVRLALTDIQSATWWMNLHPGSKLTGAGTGQASMEGEVIDSVTGEQLAAVVKSGKGNQFELDTFDALDDIKDVIDGWAKEAEQRLRELREGGSGDR